MARAILRKKRPLPAREMAEMFGVNPRTIRSWNAMKREDWIDEQAALREAVRAYHDDEGHTWPQTAAHFGMSQDAARARCYRARREREAEAAEKSKHMDGEVPLFD
jgi:uncharacterized protein YjcR